MVDPEQRYALKFVEGVRSRLAFIRVEYLKLFVYQQTLFFINFIPCLFSVCFVCKTSSCLWLLEADPARWRFWGGRLGFLNFSKFFSGALIFSLSEPI